MPTNEATGKTRHEKKPHEEWNQITRQRKPETRAIIYHEGFTPLLKTNA